MQMNDMRGTGTLMEIIHILRDDSHLVVILQFSYHPVGFIRLYLRKLLPPEIVEVKTLLSVVVKGICACQICPLFVRPQAVLATESAESAFHADTSTC